MQIRYKCFWIEVFDGDNNDVFANVYYNGTCAKELSAITEDSVISMAKSWVDSEGFEWLGFES